MTLAARKRVDPVIDRRPDDRVEELDRVIAQEQVEAMEEPCRARRVGRTRAGESRDLTQRRTLAEDHCGLDQRLRLGGQT